MSKSSSTTAPAISSRIVCAARSGSPATSTSTRLRPASLLARYGGEEFALLLPHCDTDTAEAIVGRLLEAVPGGQTASCGIAEWDA